MEKPTKAKFRAVARDFPTAKEAYVFLLDMFLADRPDILDEQWQRDYLSEGRGRRYFARSPHDLFEASPHLAEDANMYSKISGGWYANLNLNNRDKRELLFRLAAAGKWSYGTDWTIDFADDRSQGLRLEDLEI